MIVGGLFGSLVGAALFRMLQASGQIDVVIGLLYVLILGSIGGLMLKDALVALGYVAARARRRAAPRHNRWVASLPLRWRFYSSGLYISPVAPLALGFVAGILTVLLGIGGGFILVPAMIYLLGMPARVVIGTSLVMILAVSAATTMVHALTTRAVDIVLAGLLLVGGVIGAQYGALLTTRIKPDLLRLALAGHHPARRACAWCSAWPGGPTKSSRSNICERAPAPRSLLALLAPLLIAADKPVLVPDISARQVEIRYSFTGAQLLLFGAIVYPGGRAAEPAGRHRRRPARAGPADPGARKAEDRRHLDERRIPTASARRRPFMPSPRRGRSSELVDERTAAIYELGLHNLQLSPGGGALPEKERRFEAGLLDLRAPPGPLCREPARRRDQRRRALPRDASPSPARCRSAPTPPRPS